MRGELCNCNKTIFVSFEAFGAPNSHSADLSLPWQPLPPPVATRLDLLRLPVFLILAVDGGETCWENRGNTVHGSIKVKFEKRSGLDRLYIKQDNLFFCQCPNDAEHSGRIRLAEQIRSGPHLFALIGMVCTGSVIAHECVTSVQPSK